MSALQRKTELNRQTAASRRVHLASHNMGALQVALEYDWALGTIMECVNVCESVFIVLQPLKLQQAQMGLLAK